MGVLVLCPLDLQLHFKIHIRDYLTVKGPKSADVGKEYFIHADGPIYALSADVVSSLVAFRREASEDEIRATKNFIIQRHGWYKPSVDAIASTNDGALKDDI
ncbi:unnamed protein product [Camellia sinensis]